jgi:DNA (cytosine-5)-methyltransferase 1
LRAIELFAGAGGLAIGTALAGFDHEAVVEWNADACETIRSNRDRGVPLLHGWNVIEADVCKFDYGTLGREIQLVAGGPPCQPFSLGGKHRGHEDERDMFPQAVRAVRELQPLAFMVENVKGLLRQSFSSYFGYIILQLTYPEIVKRTGEEWPAHLKRLERHDKGVGHGKGLTYDVQFKLLNAANYGVPQKRERVVIVGFRHNQFPDWSYPDPTHTEARLLWDQWATGEYWERHKVAKKRRPDCPAVLARKMDRFRADGLPQGKAWRTVRDAISDLPDPRKRDWSNEIPNHWLNPGARSYAGHTGSTWDAPAKTLKAGAHGVPGGENMLVEADGSVRYFTVRESARLQTFPDDYVFRGAWGEIMRQLGNAVPVELAHAVASSIHCHLMGS